MGREPCLLVGVACGGVPLVKTGRYADGDRTAITQYVENEFVLLGADALTAKITRNRIIGDRADAACLVVHVMDKACDAPLAFGYVHGTALDVGAYARLLLRLMIGEEQIKDLIAELGTVALIDGLPFRNRDGNNRIGIRLGIRSASIRRSLFGMRYGGIFP